MKKSILIKNILVLVGVFVFWILIPADIASAQSLSISANPTQLSKGQNSTITVITSPAAADVAVSFPAHVPPPGVLGVLGRATCTTNTQGRCTVTFDSGHPTIQNNSQFVIQFARAAGYSDSGTVTITIGNPVPAGATLVSVASYTGVVNTPIQLQARTSDNRPNVDITFRLNPDAPAGVASFSPGNCRITAPGIPNNICSECSTNSSGICTASFTATSAGTFNLQMSTPSGPGFLSYGSINVPITVTNQPQVINPTIPTQNPSKYYPLAPLPNNTGGLLTEVDVGSGGSFGNYVNLIIILVIGIAAVLAVIMIIWGGLEYMTESISHKNEGKKRITEAILGLLLALGAYAILNTINPNLLSSALQIQSVQVSFQDEVETVPNATIFSPVAPVSGPYKLCTQGISKITTSGGDFIVCNSIASKLQTMVNLAWSQNPQIKISGWGWRNLGQQIQLRISNCGGNTNYNIFQKPSNQCSPPTAVPGTSRHESGLAIDFRCDGTPIQHPTNHCFIWLTQHAGTYGLKNLPSEPWHWSIDGK